MDSINFTFSDLKEKVQKMLTEKDYNDILIESVVPMFKWKQSNLNFYEFMNFEKCLSKYGVVGYRIKENDYAPVDFYGVQDTHGIFPNLHLCFPSFVVDVHDWQQDENIVLCFNNTLGTNDLVLNRIADFLTETDVSLKANILNSRYSPIIDAPNDIAQTTVENALNNSKLGKPQTIATTRFGLNENDEIKVLNLTDVKNSDKIQYLTHLHDDLFRQFYSYYGMSVNGNSKMAQQSVEEISDNNNSSFIIPYNKLISRKAFCEEMTKRGLNWSVEFSELWQSQKQKTEINETEKEENKSEESEVQNNDNEW